MKLRLVIAAVGCLLLPGLIPPTRAAAPAEAARRVDAILEHYWKEAGVSVSPPASDEVFVRRVYLDAVGRIPTRGEVEAFVDSPASDKRSVLIDRLVASDGYALSFYNFWADVLRVQSMQPHYAAYLRESLRANKPYDAFVRDMLAGSGWMWEDKASGYYARDRAMPLENMALTSRVFLGTRIECAQCHDHPFDKWKQIDFYRLAAFTYPLSVGSGDRGPAWQEVRRRNQENPARTDVQKKHFENALGRIFGALDNAAVTYSPSMRLRLPHDYPYDDAKPGDVVTPAVLFGRTDVRPGERPVDAFARWATSPDNPRFTAVVVNRLWKKVFGVGLIDPVDDIKDDTKPAVPELERYLESLLIEQRYDLKAFLAVLLNTRAYRAQAVAAEPSPGIPWHFQGPPLRRMTAEQVWDSVATLVVLNPDAPDYVERWRDERAFEHRSGLIRHIITRDAGQLEQAAGAIAAVLEQQQIRTAEVEAGIRTATAARDPETVAALTRERDGMAKVVAAKVKETMYGPFVDPKYRPPPRPLDEFLSAAEKAQLERDVASAGYGPGVPGAKAAEADRFRQERLKLCADFVRASELPSPAPNGHFLREFGQSDRLLVENASREASVPQALQLLNGKILPKVLDPASTLMIALGAAPAPDEKVTLLYRMLYARGPTASERSAAASILTEDPRHGLEDIVSAMVMTQQFLFVE